MAPATAAASPFESNSRPNRWPAANRFRPAAATSRWTLMMQESRTITRKSASNLALAFVLLPRAKRDGMSALYAFCREVDDVADNESVPAEQRREQLAAWRADVARACGEGLPEFPVNRELQTVIRQYHLP